ncbi:MAG: helix-turn-helix domain-containing protein [Hyphomicrobium sp.]
MADLEYGENDVSTPLGDKIRDQRKAKGYTLDKLAELSDSSKSYIWELENKNPPRPSAEKLASIAGALGVTVDYLIGSDEQTLVGAEDTAFFRQYSGLPEETRRQIREMARILDNKSRK